MKMEAGQQAQGPGDEQPYQGPLPGEQQQIPPVNHDPAFIGSAIATFTGFFEQYGWFLLIGVIVLLYLRNRFRDNIQQWQSQREAASNKKMDGNKAQERMEAMERARMRMQEQVDRQAREFAEKQKQKEEEKRQERLEDWERHQQGMGYRNKTKGASSGSPAPSPASGASSGSKPATQQPKKRLKPAYNPLMGDTGDVCRFRPSPRGGASGGG